MRRMRTWIGPSFKGQGLIGNRVISRKGREQVEQQPEDVIPNGVVELRVHGVNGGSPEQNLHDPSPVLISGDDTAGFYRRREELQSGPERVVEAYNWSSINSKKRVRAWWLVLFPFAAINFAGWLLPKGLTAWRRGTAQVLVRLIALCVTVLAILGMALVFVDLIGVQCAAIAACTTDFTWGWVGSIASWEPIGKAPARLAVAYSLLPALLLLGLWLIGRRSRHYEEYGAGTPESRDPVGDRIDGVRMNQVEFWQAPDVVYVQAWLHAAVALGALAAVVAFSVRELAPGGRYHDGLFALGLASFFVVGGGVLAVAFVSGMSQIPRRWLRKRDAAFWKPRASWWPAGISIGLFAAILWLGWFSTTSGPIADQPPLEAIRNGLILAAVFSIVFVFLLGLVVGAWRSVGFVLVVGWAVVQVVGRTGNRPGSSLELTALDATGWLVLEAALAVLFVGWYAWWSRVTAEDRGPSSPDPSRAYAALLGWYAWWSRSPEETLDASFRRYNVVYVYGTTALLTTCGIASFVRSDALWTQVVAPVLPVIYICAQFATQIRWGHDYPATEEMREGVAASMAGLAITAMMTMISSGAVFVAQRLGEAQAVPQYGLLLDGNQCPTGSICYPAEVGWYSLAALAGVSVLIASVLLRLLLLSVVRWRSKADDLCAEYDRVVPFGSSLEPGQSTRPAGTYDDAGTCNNSHDRRRLQFARKGVSARWLANITDDADWLIGASVMTTLTLVTAAGIARSRSFLPNEGETAIFGFASWAVAGVVVVGAFLVYSARDSRPLRGTLGILWDVMAFFPRRFHPLAPPCYAERAVIDVRNRVIHGTTRGMGGDRKPGSMILVAHSEGSLIATAALLSLMSEPQNQDKIERHPGHPLPTGSELTLVRFVTYGCMLARLYGRAWPDQLPESTLIGLKGELENQSTDDRTLCYPYPTARSLPRWMNFGRYSDYLGGRVFQELQRKPTRSNRQPEGDRRCDDVFFIDPTRRWRFQGELERARIWRHSFDYESDHEDPRFREHIWATARALNGESETSLVAEYGRETQCEPQTTAEES